MPYEDAALEALSLYINNDIHASYYKCRSIQLEHGSNAIAGAMLIWIDAALSASGHYDHMAAHPQHRIALRFLENDDPSRVQYSDDVPPNIAWAGQLMAARLGDDEPTTTALLLRLHGATAELVSDFTWAVLNICSHVMQRPYQGNCDQGKEKKEKWPWN